MCCKQKHVISTALPRRRPPPPHVKVSEKVKLRWSITNVYNPGPWSPHYVAWIPHFHLSPHSCLSEWWGDRVVKFKPPVLWSALRLYAQSIYSLSLWRHWSLASLIRVYANVETVYGEISYRCSVNCLLWQSCISSNVISSQRLLFTGKLKTRAAEPDVASLLSFSSPPSLSLSLSLSPFSPLVFTHLSTPPITLSPCSPLFPCFIKRGGEMGGEVGLGLSRL